jgi:biofilm PGA synthesis N-glycosyltransferase PgaC
MLLEILWLTTLGLNTVPFGLYIMYMTQVSRKRPWNIQIDTHYEPNISILIPTFNEETMIRRKLDNVAQADYPREKMEIVIVDSASTDRTIDQIEEWSAEHGEIKVLVIQEPERRGMVRSLNEGLRHVSGDIVVKTDADCLWLRESIRNAMKYTADPSVGSVAGLHIIEGARETSSVAVERTYRNFYKYLRIGESKLCSTVLYEGELMLVKRRLLDLIGFDEEIGADDVPTALRIADLGYRAITAEDAYFVEQTPYTWRARFVQKVRRGRHVLQSLWKYKYLNFKEDTVFHRVIMPFETYIYVVNPVITMFAVILSAILIIRYPWLLLLGVLLLIGSVREWLATHLVNSFTMLAVILSEATRREELTWEKIDEIREQIPSH